MAKAATAKAVVPLEQQFEIFEELKKILRQYNIVEVAEESGLHFTTLYGWLDDTTFQPRLSSMLAVLPVLGYELVLQRIRTSKPKKHRHLRIVK